MTSIEFNWTKDCLSIKRECITKQCPKQLGYEYTTYNKTPDEVFDFIQKITKDSSFELVDIKAPDCVFNILDIYRKYFNIYDYNWEVYVDGKAILLGNDEIKSDIYVELLFKNVEDVKSSLKYLFRPYESGEYLLK